jgi:PKD repeat protein
MLALRKTASARETQFMSKSLRLRLMLVAVICLMAAILTATIISSAATPSNGTLSTSGGALSYTGGPFANNNQSAPTSDVSPQCVGTTLPCDDYALTVSIPTGSHYDVDVNIGWTDSGGTASDFDLFIFNSSGTRVTYAATSKNPEHATFPASNGTYTVRVVPYDTPGTVKYNGTIQLVPTGGGSGGGPTPTPAPAVPGQPRFFNYLSPAGVADSAGEPSLGVNWNTGNVMFYGGVNTEPSRATFDDCPSPARLTWVTTPSTTASATRALGDPILFTDRVTGRTLVSQLEGGTKQSTTDYTDDDGAHFTPTQGSGVNSGVDHQTLGGGPFGATSSIPHPSYPNAVYYCAQDAGDANCALSIDGGVTFGPAVPIYNTTQCTGLHGHVKVAPDGTVYVPNRGCGGTPVGTPVTARDYQGVAVSTNNGITWTVKPVTGSHPNSNDPSLGIGADGTLYFGYADNDNHPKVQVSHDKGTTWSIPTDLGAPLGVIQTAFPEAVAGDANRAAVGFLGSTAAGNPNDINTFRGIWHAYIAMTYDGGVTWTTIDTTPDDPVQIGSICLTGTTCGADRNLDDFNDITVDKKGRVLMAYADGCVAPACTTATAAGNPPYNASRTAKGAIIRQAGGKRLFAQYDPTEPAVPAPPRVDSVSKDSAGIVHLSWSMPDNSGSALTGYNVYRRTGNGAYAKLNAAPLNKTTYDDESATPNTQYFYKVTAINAIGEGANCGEFTIGVSVDLGNPCTLPGLLVLADASGDQTGAVLGQNNDLDIQSVSLAEPFYTDGSQKLVFTMKVADLSTIPANRQWRIIWTPPTPPNVVGGQVVDDRYYIGMTSGPSGGAASVSYEYGTVSANGNVPTKKGDNTTGDVLGSFTPAGVIQLTIADSKVGGVHAGDVLSVISGRNFAGNGAASLTKSSAADSTGDAGYVLVGNDSCRPNTAPVAQLTATPTSGNLPLQVNFNGGGSSDPDAGDSIASYTFDFGDGTQPVTQASPTISHTYYAAGQFAARLTVKDSHGLVSGNTPEVVITVNDSTVRMNYALSSNGGTATGSTEHESGGFPAISAINGDRTGGNWGGGTGGWNDNTRGVFPDSLVVSFNGSKTIDEIRLYTLQNNFRSAVEPTPSMTCDYYGLIDFDVQTWDGAQWVTIPGGNVTGNNSVMRVFNFPAVTTTKIRVVVNNAQNNYSRIVELEAFGAGGQ